VRSEGSVQEQPIDRETIKTVQSVDNVV